MITAIGVDDTIRYSVDGKAFDSYEAAQSYLESETQWENISEEKS